MQFCIVRGLNGIVSVPPIRYWQLPYKSSVDVIKFSKLVLHYYKTSYCLMIVCVYGVPPYLHFLLKKTARKIRTRFEAKKMPEKFVANFSLFFYRTGKIPCNMIRFTRYVHISHVSQYSEYIEMYPKNWNATHSNPIAILF